jgi:hypothetical protein
LDSVLIRLLLGYNLFPIDISKFCNRGFKDEEPGVTQDPDKKKIRGWSAQGPENDVRDLPVGKNVMGGIPFWIVDPADNNGAGCIALWNAHDQSLPDAIQSIPVNRKADSLYFLHSSCWNEGGGKPGWKYVFHYKGFMSLMVGQDPTDLTQTFEVRQGLEVGEWRTASSLPNAVVGWQGKNLSGSSVCVFMTEWKNPFPNREIESIEIVSGKNGLYPLIVSITGACKK